ncbi:MAG: efflux RND transporter periplasmic adaptor subunit [Lautropia sp.]|nr:efflux RND transporter periplasmic adaptor subunit [Lautropia sp.]
MILAACGEQAENDAMQPASMKVNVVRAQGGEWMPTLSLSGNAVAREDVAVGTALQGLQVLDVKVEVGDRVEKGQLLAVLEHSNVQSQLAQNSAALIRAKANLASQRSALKEAESTLKRYRILVKDEAVSRQDFDQQQMKAESAKAAVQVALAEITQIRAQLADNRHQRSKAQVTAPVSGVITRRAVETGSLTSSNALFHIAKDGETEVQADVSRDELALVRQGLPADIHLGAKTTIGGTVRLVPPEMDSSRRVAKIRITPNEKLNAAIGSDVRVIIHLPKNRVAVSLPFSAVAFDADGKAFAKVVDAQGKVHKRALEIGTMHQSTVEILSGLQADEQVVQQAGAFVDDGDTVSPQPVEGGEK